MQQQLRPCLMETWKCQQLWLHRNEIPKIIAQKIKYKKEEKKKKHFLITDVVGFRRIHFVAWACLWMVDNSNASKRISLVNILFRMKRNFFHSFTSISREFQGESVYYDCCNFGVIFSFFFLFCFRCLFEWKINNTKTNKNHFIVSSDVGQRRLLYVFFFLFHRICQRDSFSSEW